jgi:phosphate starvation-inducible PhoH-like protein
LCWRRLSNLTLFLKGYTLRKRKTKKPIDATKKLVPDENVVGFKNRLKPRTINQRDYIRTVAENTITFCQGVPGSGKTHIAIGMALEYLLDFKVEKIVITRPVVEAGEKLGYLPGTAEEKLHPYLLPLFDEINYFLQMQSYTKLKVGRKIEVVPLGLMRGRSFHDAFIVADECQNASYDQLKMLLTRIGTGSKMVLTGDTAQSDLHRQQQGGFLTLMNRLEDIDGVGSASLEASDIVRNPIIGYIVDRLEHYENNSS